MNAKQLFPKTYAQYSNGNLTREQLPDAALEEANGMGFGRPHNVKKLFLNTLLFGTRTVGYSLSAVVGASVLVPGFLAFDMMFARVNPALKYLYAYSLVFGAAGLGLTSYYIGRATHTIAKAISRKIELIKCIEGIEKETAVKAFLSEIRQ